MHVHCALEKLLSPCHDSSNLENEHKSHISQSDCEEQVKYHLWEQLAQSTVLGKYWWNFSFFNFSPQEDYKLLMAETLSY